MIKGKKILFDPFITYNELARHIDVDSIEADYIFLSHAHEDHIADCISIASRGLPDGSYGGNPMGFVFTSEEGNFYYSGDTALTLDMQLVPQYASLGFAVLPIGDNFTMDARDAVQAAKFVQCRKIVGVHYDTFGFIKIDHAWAQQLFAEEGMQLFLPAPGESLEL